MKNTTAIGNIGEDLVAEYLAKNGAEVICRNYRSRYGEIDIIATFNGFLMFIEVKKRKNTNFGLPCEFVTSTKQKKIIQTALYYLDENKTDLQPRFDVVEVYGEKINYIKNAFEA